MRTKKGKIKVSDFEYQQNLWTDMCNAWQFSLVIFYKLEFIKGQYCWKSQMRDSV
jgi:hypothetical protein